MSKNREQNRALAAALRSAGHTDVRPVWADAKALLNSGLTYEQVAQKLGGKVSEPKPKYTVKQLPPFRERKRVRTTAQKKRGAAVRKAGKVREPQVQYDAAPQAFTVALERDGAERLATLQVWPARPKANGTNGVTHTAALIVDGVMRKLSLSKRALKNLKNGAGTWLWWEGRGHVATLAAQ